jgi:glutamate racemase
MSDRAQAPIGVYDSGLGGLSVVRQVRRLLPRESILYVADNARVPYGGRSPEEIRTFSRELIAFLCGQGVKLIAIACNTSSVLVLPTFAQEFDLPLLGLAQAGAEFAASFQHLGVLATAATIRSGVYRQLLRRVNPEIRLTELACPDFVPLVENGGWEQPETRHVVARRLAMIRSERPQAFLLGCSHFPYLQKPLRHVLGPEIPLLDPAAILAAQIASVLQSRQVLNATGDPTCRFYVTGACEPFQTLAADYLADASLSVRTVDLTTENPLSARLRFPLPV